MFRWLLTVALILGVGSAFSADNVKRVATNDLGLAIEGYDTVAYFTMNKPVKGEAQFTATWQGARWHFVSADNRDKFESDPDRYAPQFGAYCTMAMTKGIAVTADPLAWKIVEGRLYLKAVPGPWTDFDKARPRLLTEAQRHWQKIGPGN